MRSCRHLFLIPTVFLLAGCMAAVPSPNKNAPDSHVQRGTHVDDVATRRVSLPATLPAMKAFPATRGTRPIRSNSLIMGDFLDLSFQLESGRPLPVLSRFEGPISVTVAGRAPCPHAGRSGPASDPSSARGRYQHPSRSGFIGEPDHHRDDSKAQTATARAPCRLFRGTQRGGLG